MFLFLVFLLGCLIPLKFEVGCFACLYVSSFLEHKAPLFFFCLDLIVWFFLLVCFLKFCFFIPIEIEEIPDTANKTKSKCREKHPITFFQLAPLCSQILFSNFGGVGFKHANLCWKCYKKIVVSAKIQTTKNESWKRLHVQVREKTTDSQEHKEFPAFNSQGRLCIFDQKLLGIPKKSSNAWLAQKP